MLDAGKTAYIALVVLSAALFAICCATDFVDGHIARKTNTVSMLGKLLDPLADKVVIVIMLFLLVYFKDGLDSAFAYNTLVIAVFRELSFQENYDRCVPLNRGKQRIGSRRGYIRQNQDRVP